MVQAQTVASEQIRRDRAEGSILGAFIGDSVGSAVEFKSTVTPEMVEMSMKMPGNVGPWKLAPGQVTDDSELAMALLHALALMPAG
jgi:ADP-ribosyl-[dinitrogen reductase] hydrolase